MLLAAVFGVGGIGQALYPKLSTKELASGDYISVRPDESASKVGLDHEESHLITKAMMKLAFLIFVVISVIGFYHDLPLWKTVLFAILWAAVVPAGSFIYFALVGRQNRRRVYEKPNAATIGDSSPMNSMQNELNLKNPASGSPSGEESRSDWKKRFIQKALSGEKSRSERASELASLLYTQFVIKTEDKVEKNYYDRYKDHPGFQQEILKQQIFLYLVANVALTLTDAGQKQNLILDVIESFRNLVRGEMYERWRYTQEAVDDLVESTAANYANLLYTDPEKNRALSFEWAQDWLKKVGVEECHIQP